CVGTAVRFFFGNLLPEGQVRQAVARRLGLSEDNDWAMLAAIGGDCAGALSILPLGEAPPDTEHWQYTALSRDVLDQLVNHEGQVPLLVGGATTRLSLAGAQDKVPVAMFDGRMHLPTHSAPSTHVLKLPNPLYADLTVNEAFVTALAQAAGLPAVESELASTEPPALLVRRFDRRTSNDTTVRIHQEDFCQALGLNAGRKYEQEGGPSLARCADLIRRASVEPLKDIMTLMRWVSFNLCVGNADAHGKNLALLYDPTGIRLAPLYDLVSTHAYRRLDPRFAMSVGGERDSEKLQKTHWTTEAKKLGMSPPVVIRFIKQTAESVLKAIDKAKITFEQKYGHHLVTDQIEVSTKRRAQRLLSSL
ncbi:MAG: type II toxin-antitoxin system HipA family toxin, partial [Myxococcota bacterium]